jgi:hypothetical protein
MPVKKYQIKPLVWLVRDEASVKFHVASDDYFGTIATILSLLKQQIKKDDPHHTAALEKTWHNLEKDLLFLQKNYQIKLKIRNKNITPKGRLISQ